jgi:hypothetical protein
MELGLVNEGITEVIAVTRNNAAPIGIIVKPGMSPRMILYKGSKTAENIRTGQWVTANFVSDAYYYAYYAFRDVNPDDLISVFAGGTGMQWLRFADAWMGFRTTILHETDETYYVELIPVSSDYFSESIRGLNRGFNNVIDAAVHATRYVKTGDPDLRELIEYHLKIVQKCGGPREHEAAAFLREVCGLPETVF